MSPEHDGAPAHRCVSGIMIGPLRVAPGGVLGGAAGALVEANFMMRSEKLNVPSWFICTRAKGPVTLISLNTHALPKNDESWKFT